MPRKPLIFPVEPAGLGDEPEIASVGTDNQKRIITRARNLFIFASSSYYGNLFVLN
jgi:hypothetical protein